MALIDKSFTTSLLTKIAAPTVAIWALSVSFSAGAATTASSLDSGSVHRPAVKTKPRATHPVAKMAVRPVLRGKLHSGSSFKASPVLYSYVVEGLDQI